MNNRQMIDARTEAKEVAKELPREMKLEDKLSLLWSNFGDLYPTRARFETVMRRLYAEGS